MTKKNLISIDKSNGTDYGCKVIYRELDDGHIEIVKVEYLPTKRELESENKNGLNKSDNNFRG